MATTVNPNYSLPFCEKMVSSATLAAHSFFNHIKLLIPLLVGYFCILLGALILTGVITTIPSIAAGYFLSLGVTLVIVGAGLCAAFKRPLFSVTQSKASTLLHISCD